MPDVELTGIEFKIVNDSADAVRGIDALRESLAKLKSATSGGVSGVSSVARQVTRLKEALNGFDSSTSGRIKSVANAVKEFDKLKNVKISSTINNNLRKIVDTVHSTTPDDISKITTITSALTALSSLERPRIGTYLNQLKKIPEVVKELDKVDLDKFANTIKRLSADLKPFADEMFKVHQGFNAFPSRIQRLITSTERYNGTMKKARESTAGFGGSLKMLNFSLVVHWMRQAGHFLGGMINEASKYRENLNMFTVAMGDYAQEAFEYGKTVSEVMGIDISDWIRNQGIFQTLLTGFGNTAERAAFMSKNLTQLGYDIASFFDIKPEEAMIKLQSGISGELEPLRRLGYDLSQAKLQATAAELGISGLVSQMSQAEKAELRYYAIMTQVTTAQGDMARTLNEPANQLRVLRAQVKMAARSIGNLFIPALNAILPVGIAVAQIIRGIADAIASFFGVKLPEVDFDVGNKLGNNLDEAAKGAENLGNGLGKATEKAKKLKQYTASFDELNVFAPQTDTGPSGAGGIGGGGIGGGGGLGFELPGYDFIGEAVGTRVEKIKQIIEESLKNITAMLGGFSLAIGAMLVLTGANIPKGLALMVVGAAALAADIALNWNSMNQELAGTLTLVTGTVSGFMLALGAIMAFSGANVPLGIGLMAVGAVSLAASVAVNWKAMDNKVLGVVKSLTGILAGGEIAVGAMLAMTGVNMPLGIALIAAGAVTLASAVALNWKSTDSPIANTVTRITLLVSSGLLALGAILAFSGGSLPLGIGLMVAGAVGLASSVAMNWDSVKNKVSNSLREIGKIASVSLMSIGVILCLSGAGIGLGLAMIAAAAGLTFAAWSIDDNPIIRLVKNMANGIIGVINHVVDVVNRIFDIDFDGLDIFGKQVIPPIHVKLVHLNHVPMYANGGFPDEGSLFIANEAGPEMVGKIGRRSAVVNNEQIVESVSTGVSVANEEVVAALYALMKIVEEKDLNVSIGDDEIGRSNERYTASRGAQVDSSVFGFAY